MRKGRGWEGAGTWKALGSYGVAAGWSGVWDGTGVGSPPKRKSSCGHAGLTLRVQQTRQPQVLLSRAEGSLQVVVGIGLGEFAEVHEIRPGQGHRAGRQQADSRASGQGGRKTSSSEPHPQRGAGGVPPGPRENCVRWCVSVHLSEAVRTA